MYTGQLSMSGPFDAAYEQAARDIVAPDDGTEGTFALLFETALGISGQQCSGIGASNHPFYTNADTEGLLGNNDSSSSEGMLDSAITNQFFSPAMPAQVMPAAISKLNDPLSFKPLQVATPATRARASECPAQTVGPDDNLASTTKAAGALDKSELSDWMDAHALTRSSHHCALYCRLGMEAAGLNTADRPQSGDAGDYGPFLLRHGAQAISQDSYVPQVGDVVVFDKTSQHPFGHIEMYDGHRWVSDFMQHSLSPYRDSNSAPPFTIYRIA